MSEDKDVEITLSDQVKGQMEADPNMAAAIRDFSACMRQAFQAVKDGQHKSWEDAIEAITGTRPEVVDEIPDFDADSENISEIRIQSSHYANDPEED